MKSFLAEVAERIYKERKGNMDGVAVVFNNRRPTQFLQRDLGRLHGGAFFLPKCMGMNDLIEQLGGKTIMPNEFLLYELYRMYCKQEGDDARYGSFEDFISFGDMLLGDFSEVDLYCVDAKSIFCNLYDLKVLGEWNIDGSEPTDFQKRYMDFYKKLADYYDNFRTTLASRNIAYSGMAYRDVAENIATAIKQVDYEYVYFVGFNALSKSESLIVKEFINSGRGMLITDGDAYYYDDESHEAGRFLRKQNAEFGIKAEYAEHFAGKKQITIATCSENLQQVKYAAEVLRRIKCDEGEDLTDTAVVLADEKLLVPMLNTLPDVVKTVNVTMGFPYSQSQVHSMALKFIDLRNHVKDGKFFYRDVLVLLSDWIVRSVAKNYDYSAIEKKVCDEHLIFMTYDKVRELVGEGCGMLMEFFSAECSDVAQFLQKCVSFANLLYDSGSLDSNQKERESLGCWLETLRYIIKLHDEYKVMANFSTLMKIYDRLSRKRSVAFYGEPLSGLQLLGMLESRNLDFRRIILLSANEGVLPSGRSQNSLIPFNLKHGNGMPTYSEKEAVYANHFYNLIQRADEVYLVYHTNSEGVGKGEASRYVMQVRDELCKRYANIVLREKIVVLDNKPAQTAVGVEVRKDEHIMKRLEDLCSSSRGISPSALNTYRACSLRYYYEYVLGIRDNDNDVEEVDSSEAGTCIHEILQQIYEPDKGKSLQIKTLRDGLTELPKLIQTVFDKHNVGNDVSSQGRNMLWRKVAETEVSNLLNAEIELLNSGPAISIEKLEEKFTSEYLLASGVKVWLQGTADRVDRIGGELRIVDYKTGKVEEKDLDAKDGNYPDKLFQVLYYAWLYGRVFSVELKRAGVHALSNPNLGFVEADCSNLADFEDYVKGLLGGLLDKEVPFTPTVDENNCKYCVMKSYCGRALTADAN